MHRDQSCILVNMLGVMSYGWSYEYSYDSTLHQLFVEFIIFLTLVRISADVMPATLASSGFIFLKKFLWCFGFFTWLKMSSEVPQADLHPSSLHVYIRWSCSFLGLMNSVIYSSPMAGSPHPCSSFFRVRPMSTLGLAFLMFFTLGAFWGCSLGGEKNFHHFQLCQLYLVGDAHDFALKVTSLPDVLVARDMVPKRLQRLEVAVANKTEENSLLSGFPVLVAEILRDLPEISRFNFPFKLSNLTLS